MKDLWGNDIIPEMWLLKTESGRSSSNKITTEELIEMYDKIEGPYHYYYSTAHHGPGEKRIDKEFNSIKEFMKFFNKLSTGPVYDYQRGWLVTPVNPKYKGFIGNNDRRSWQLQLRANWFINDDKKHWHTEDRILADNTVLKHIVP